MIKDLKDSKDKMKGELDLVQKSLRTAQKENQKMAKKLSGSTELLNDALTANTELEDLLWNYLVLSLKLSGDSWNNKWNTMGQVREKVRKEKVPYSRWGEYILQELDAGSGDQEKSNGSTRRMSQSRKSKR